MAIVITDDKHYEDIAAAIRTKNGEETTYKPSEMAGAIMDLGANEEEINEAFEAGKKAEYDKFWDAYQQNGTRTLYDREGGRNFAAECWDFTNFYPKYDIRPTTAGSMFYNWSDAQHVGDLAQRLQDCGVVLDTSNATNMYGMFRYARSITRIPAIDARGVTNDSGMNFAFGDLLESDSLTIDKLIVGDHVNLTDAFNRARSLVSITFEGVIGSNLNMSWSSKLNQESVQSIIECLKDLTGLDTLTLSLHAGVGAALTDEQKATITAKNWTLVY